jgi:hypothetical protein
MICKCASDSNDKAMLVVFVSMCYVLMGLHMAGSHIVLIRGRAFACIWTSSSTVCSRVVVPAHTGRGPSNMIAFVVMSL